MGKCKFNNQWLNLKDGNGFLISVWCQKTGDSVFFCKCCSRTVNVEKKGFQAITQHVESAKHIKLCRESFGQTQTFFRSNLPSAGSSQLVNISSSIPDSLTNTSSAVLPNTSKSDNICVPSTSKSAESVLCETQSGVQLNIAKEPVQLCLLTNKENTYASELIWVLKVVYSNYSFASCSGVDDVFKIMFKDSSTAREFSLSSKKVHYILNYALFPYFRELMLEDIQDSLFTLSYDETTNVESKKELAITLTYWSEKKSSVVTRHLETRFLGKADAVTLHRNLKEAMDSAGLPLRNLLMVACDGPNVNKKVISLMNEDVKTVRKNSLVDVGTCNIHIVHNAYLQGLHTFGEEASDLTTMIYLYFDGYPSRCEEYENIQNSLKLPQNKFLKHTPSRWLTFKTAAERLLEQWKGIKKYFLKHIPSTNSQGMKSVSYKKIVQYLKEPSIKAQILFAISSAELFTTFTSKFQSEAPQIHTLYENLNDIVVRIVGRICQSQNLNNLDEDVIFNSSNLLPLKDITVSDKLKEEISVLTEKDQLLFLKNVQSHYISACKHVLKKSAIKSKFVKALKCLNPENICSPESCKDIATVANALPLNVSEEYLVDEWKLLRLLELPTNIPDRIDDFWNMLFCKQTVHKFETLPNVVKAALSLSHGNADVERRFSVSRWALTEDRAAMSEKTLNSIMVVKDEVRLHKNQVHLIPITRKLISYASSARRRYNEFLEEEKNKRDMEKKRLEEMEKLKQEEIQRSKKRQKEKETLEKASAELKEKTEEYSQSRDLVKQMFSEATERLSKAINSNNVRELHLAQAMFEGVKKLQDEENAKHKEVDNLRKDVDKRKSSLITSFFTKKQKLQ